MVSAGSWNSKVSRLTREWGRWRRELRLRGGGNYEGMVSMTDYFDISSRNSVSISSEMLLNADSTPFQF